MSRYFPMFVDLQGKRITVVGAGRIATRRVRTLLDFGAHVTVLASEASEEIRELAREGRLAFRQHTLSKVLLEEGRGSPEKALFAESFFVLAATDDSEVNQAVYKLCKALGVPVNLSNDRECCDFYFPGIAKGGGVVAGITAEGADHALARKATEEIRALLAGETQRKAFPTHIE